jgi:hypothetical protein
LRERDQLEDPGIDGRIILRWIFRKRYLGMDRIDLAKDRDRCWTLVYAVMNLRVQYNARNILTENRLASEEVLCCME